MIRGIGSLFSGIGGLELGLERAGLGPVVWQCEIDPFCRAVLAKHWPKAARYADVASIRTRESVPRVDLLCGGFPCQDLSGASHGMGEGLHGESSSLWFHYARVAGIVRPRFVVVENVASGANRWLRTVRHGLHMLGYRTRALRVDARDVGAPHARRRIFVVGDSNQNGKRPLRLNDEASGMSANAGTLRGGWPPPPGLRRMDDGLPGELDSRRVPALGNAVVWQCAYVVGKVILAMDQAA